MLLKQERLSIWLPITIKVFAVFICGETDISLSWISNVLIAVCVVYTALCLVLIFRVTRSSQLGTFLLHRSRSGPRPELRTRLFRRAPRHLAGEHLIERWR